MMLNLEYLAELADQHRDALGTRVESFTLGKHPRVFGSEPALMGVVNLSADSWYRESVCPTTDSAVQRGRVLALQGADIIDVGAESTLAKAQRVGAEDQQSRLLPVIRELGSRKILVSVETYETAVARACLEAGAQVINLTGTQAQGEVYREVAEHDAAVIICHVQGNNVREVGDFDLSDDPISMMYESFARQIELATRCGVTKLFIDPGMGFYYRNLEDSAVRVSHQIKTFLNTFRLRKLGWPICHALPHAFDYFREEVRCAEPFFAVLAALGGTDLFRTHEVTRVKAVLDTMRINV